MNYLCMVLIAEFIQYIPLLIIIIIPHMLQGHHIPSGIPQGHNISIPTRNIIMKISVPDILMRKY